MYPEFDDLSDYLASDAIIDWQTHAVRRKALELTGSLFDLISTNLPQIAEAGAGLCRGPSPRLF